MDSGGEIITTEGEVIEHGQSLTVLGGTVVADLAKAEIAQQVATAREFPRSVTRAVKSILSLATLDEQAAQECIYALPRGGKPIRGPSIRLAEIVQQQWGNNRVAARVIEVDRHEKVIVAEAVFHDLETNAAIKTTCRRRIVDKHGRLFSDDMIVVTGNAANSIARRNAILAGVPKAVWRRAYDACEGVIKGDVKTLAERRYKLISDFGTWGVKPEQIYAAIGVKGQEEVTIEHLPTLAGMFQAIKNGEETVESLFSTKAIAAGKPYDKVPNPLNDEGGSEANGTAPATNAGADGKPAAAGSEGAGEGKTVEAGGSAGADPVKDRNSVAAKPKEEKSTGATKPKAASPEAPGAIDTDSADYKRGYEDRMRGTKKCLNDQIRETPERMRHWEAGWAVADAQDSAGEHD